jgi:hypothetical protein
MMEFELARVMTVRRLTVTMVMVLFPPVMILILSQGNVDIIPELTLSVFCGMVCFLSLLLWATPNVYAELEGKSWTFVTTRPRGRLAILFGKYLIAAGWSFGISWLALSVSILCLHPFTPLNEELTRLELWTFLSLLLLLASMVYAAIFSLLGVLMQRRAMPVAVGYFLLVEVVLALVPAVVGKLAMTFHLFSLMTHWIGYVFPAESDNDDFQMLYGVFPVWVHLAAIFVMTTLSLSLAAYVIRAREYITLEDAQI